MPKEFQKIDHCPNCGAELTLWQQVMLSVDHSLMCRNCWRRIVIDTLDSIDSSDNFSNSKIIPDDQGE
ncbi:MAG TPA: hypothetical protein PK595_02410 [Bacteroidota bacterium]|nr:hypothetical protein [Bacteroidota bacterium]